jgi:hypothetical protein
MFWKAWKYVNELNPSCTNNPCSKNLSARRKLNNNILVIDIVAKCKHNELYTYIVLYINTHIIITIKKTSNESLTFFCIIALKTELTRRI